MQPRNRSSFNCNGNNVCKDMGRDRVRIFAQYTHSRSHVPAMHTRNKNGKVYVLPGRYSCRNSHLRRTKPPATFPTYSSIMIRATVAASFTEQCDSLSDMLALAVNPNPFAAKMISHSYG